MFKTTIRVGPKAAAIGLALSALISAAQARDSDDFNRPDGSLGSDYTAQGGGEIVIRNGAATSGQNQYSPNFVTLNGSAGTSASVDVSANRAGNYGYVALSLGYRAGFDLNSYFVKVQDNNGDGIFDAYGFGRGNAYSGSDTLFAALGTNFATGTMTVSYIGTVAMLAIASAAGTQTYTFDYGGLAPVGREVGLGLTGNGIADNLRVGAAVPGPLAGAGLVPLLGLAGAGLLRRRRRHAA